MAKTVIYYILVFFLLLVLELLYFRAARRFGIMDRPNWRSNHSIESIRGGGILFFFAVLLWSVLSGFPYPWMLGGLTLAAGISFADDIKPVKAKPRLIVHFIAMVMVFQELQILRPELWLVVLLSLIVYVGATNVYNFMDGVNGMTGMYTIAVLIPLMIKNRELSFAEPGLMAFTMISLVIFCWFNFRPNNKAVCFAGDVGAIGISVVVLFLIGLLAKATGDITWLTLLIVYGVDGCYTLVHRVMLHEHLLDPHRKNMFHIMANELSIGHQVVSASYAVVQLVISLVMIYVIPCTFAAHVIYLFGVLAVLTAVYLIFMKKYYHLHAEAIASKTTPKI